jgi:hypothetical protein
MWLMPGGSQARSQYDHPEDAVGANIFRTSQTLNLNFLAQTPQALSINNER